MTHRILFALLVALAALAVALAAPAQVGSNLLLGTGRASSILRVALVGIAINVAATIALVEVWGVMGISKLTVVQTGPGQFRCTDPTGTVGALAYHAADAIRQQYLRNPGQSLVSA